MAHAYFITGESESGVESALAFVEAELGLMPHGNPDVIVQRYGLFRVDDARALLDTVIGAPVAGDHKAVVISVSRLFHETQNALLKLFEEPPAHTTLILALPAEGMLLPTLRSRLTRMPATTVSATRASGQIGTQMGELAQAFLDADDKEREKLIGKLVDRSKSDTDDEKQRARMDAVRLVEDLIRALAPKLKEGTAAAGVLADLDHFLPMLHTRSAPLKPILEHIRIAWRTVESQV